MRYPIALAVLVLFLSSNSSPAMATDCTGYNACWWNGLGRDQKIAAVQGMISAEKYAYATAQTEDAKIFKLGLQNPRYLHFYKTADVYVKSIDAFYASKSNASVIVGAVLACLADNPPDGCKELGS